MTAIIEHEGGNKLAITGKHSNELFVCPYEGCGRMFKAQFSMNRHLVVHSQVKNQLCKYCGKAFTLPQYLREHEYTHTKELPYICGVKGCARRFRQAGKLSLHRRTHPEYITKKYDYTLNQQKRTKKQPKSSNNSKKSEANKVSNGSDDKRKPFSCINLNNEEKKETKKLLPSMKYVREYLDHSTNTLSLTTVAHDHQNMKHSQTEMEREEMDSLAKFLERVYTPSISPSSRENESPKPRAYSSLDLFDLTKKYGEK